MSRSAKTVFYFGIYLLAEGIFLMVAPSSLLEIIGLPEADTIWRVILGFVVAILGYYYIRNSKENLIPFFGFTVQIRIVQFVFFLYLYLTSEGTLTLTAFSFIELVAGLWTFLALKQELKS